MKKSKIFQGAGQKLYKKARKLIPGGTMLLSKKPEMFAPEIWPSYFSKAKGINIWDLDGRKYFDFSIMGIGTNILGYGRKEIDSAVKSSISKGNMSTLNCPEEVYLAEELIKMNPWADMVRFARSGGEANAISIRIARAASNREQIAVCGYHGWHDWYLSANLGNTKKLDGHLLPGLNPLGVPSNLRGLTIPFDYGDTKKIEALIKSNSLAAVKMEVSRSSIPDIQFLKKIRSLTKKHNTILIFDECTSGFRECYGGLYKKYNIDPDMVMYGKTLGNGYAITAVVGTSEVMSAAQDSFISSTFWTERIGSVAALKTLEIMRREKPWVIMNKQAIKVREIWKEADKDFEIGLKIGGLPVLSNFIIDHPDWNKYKTFITQEGLRNNMLLGNSIYICALHTDRALEKYRKVFRKICQEINLFKNGKLIDNCLEGPECQQGFKRLN
ncbi:aminotransferase class III-fold pyridoxal phosphate-dependent enzyme [Gammaproteobacteria bacterium]|nr:aminotransferase class III-fold pyridoxal phosphate-dependent enzyme [Gammaproteobacteria bacterium]